MKKSRARPWRVDGSQIKGLCVFSLDDKYDRKWPQNVFPVTQCKWEKEVTSKWTDVVATLTFRRKKNQPPHLHNWEFIMLLKSKVMICYFNIRVKFAWVLLSCQLMCGTSFSPWSYSAPCCVQGVTANHRRHLSSFLNPPMVLLVKQNGVITDGCNRFSVLSTSDQHHWRWRGPGWERARAPLRL